MKDQGREWPPLAEPRRGRIGTARRVHIITHHDARAEAGVARCGWAGQAVLVEDEVTCRECRAP